MKDILGTEKSSLENLPHGHNFPSVREMEELAMEVKESIHQYQSTESQNGRKLDWDSAKNHWKSHQDENSRHTAELAEDVEPYMLLDE